MKRAGIHILGIVVLLSCSGDPFVPESGYAYQPLSIGQSWIYQVSETTINPQSTVVLEYELQVIVSESYLDGEDSVYMLTRQIRENTLQEWQPVDTWSMERTHNQLIQNESNVNFVKLVFPIGPVTTWNGNQYNNLPDNGNIFNGVGSELYQLSEFEKPYALPNGTSFERTITVIHNNFSDAIVGQDERHEVYAYNVGLIEKEITQLQYCSTPGCLGQQQVNQGYIYTQTLKSYEH